VHYYDPSHLNAAELIHSQIYGSLKQLKI